jgi:hypothetical protein
LAPVANQEQIIHKNPFWDNPKTGLFSLPADHLAAHVKSIHSEPYRLLLSLLVRERKRADITQQDLSCALGRPQSFVSKYERGERRLDVIEFLEICRHLQADAFEILKAVDPQHNNFSY